MMRGSDRRLAMNKETLIAAAVGLGLGLIVTVGVYSMKRTLTPDPTNQLTVSPTPATTDENQVAGDLVVTAPEDGLLVNEEKITVKGTGPTNSQVVILVGNADSIVKTGSDGQFEAEVALKTGPNVISVISVDESGQVDQIEKLVVLESSVAQPTSSASPSPTTKVSPSPTTKATPKLSPSPTAKLKATATPTLKP